MTVIAWDGKTLAADRQCSNNGTMETVTKIWKVRGHLLAGCGNMFLSLAMVTWFTDGADPTKYPKDAWAIGDGGNFWVIEPDGVLHEFSLNLPIAVVVDPKPMSIGCGRRSALTAMHLGCDARRAVEVACELEIDCGGGIDTLTL